MEAVLAEDFLEIGLSGRIYDKKQVLQALLSEPEVHYEMMDFAMGHWLERFYWSHTGPFGRKLQRTRRFILFAAQSGNGSMIDGKWFFIREPRKRAH